MANLIGILGHHGDEVAKLGKTAKTWGDDAIQGTAHFLVVTAGVAGDAKKLLTTFAKQFPGNPRAGEEWFRSINKIIDRFPDVSKSGLKEFLTKPARNAPDVRGSYGVLRLAAEAPELAGKNIDTIFEQVKHVGRKVEGIDLDTLSSTGLRELWEIKHVTRWSAATSETATRQVSKHIQTKVLTVLDDLPQGLGPDQITNAMGEIKLKFSYIVEGAVDNVDKKLWFDTIEGILIDDFPELVEAGFKFDLDDILIRNAAPLKEIVETLPAIL